MKYKPVILIMLLTLMGIWGCGPSYPDPDPEDSYPVPEFSDPVLNYNVIRQELHCEVKVNYDSIVTDLRLNLDLQGFTQSALQTTLNDSGILGDALPGDKIFSRNVSVDHIDSIDAKILALFDIYEGGISIRTITDSLDIEANLPPVITEIVMPDTIVRPQSGTKDLLVSVSVDDPNGIYDVVSAFFQVLSNTTGQWSADFSLNDTGELGDRVAGDGVFSSGLQISSANSAGTNFFRFRVKDTANNFSDWSLDSVVVR